MTWQTRLIQERDELKDRLDKLTVAMAYKSDAELTEQFGKHAQFLEPQRQAMAAYLAMLEQRIQLLEM